MRVGDALDGLLQQARSRAVEQRQALCDAEQVLETLLRAIDETRAADRVERFLTSRPELGYHPPAAELARSVRNRALIEAERLASDQGAEEIAPEHLLHALLGPHSPIPSALRDEVVRSLRRRETSADEEPQRSAVPAEPASHKAESAASLLEPMVPTPEDDALTSRPELVDRLLQTLLFGNPLLVGAPGTGRRSLIRLLVKQLAQGPVPGLLQGWSLVSLDPTRLHAGTAYRGELEERVQGLVQELGRRERTVLVVRDLALLTGSRNGHGSFDVASALAPALRSGRVRLLGVTTPDDLREKLEGHAELLEALTPILMEPPDEQAAVALLARLTEHLERRFGTGFETGVVARSVALCRQHVPHRALPGEAVTLLEAAAAALAFETAMLERDGSRATSRFWSVVGGTLDGSRPTIGERNLLLALSERHRIPFGHLQDGVAEKLQQLQDSFRRSLFGQDHVLETVLRTVKVGLTELADERRPRARLFFVGPPGTGKTECARLLARFLMGTESALLRFDMSDYAEASSVSTLLGSDKGLVGSEEGGRLTEPLRVNPHRIVLFDEIEKAHPHVFNLFLQILDNGEIRDKRDHIVTFRHALCIFTSNVGCNGQVGLFGLTREQIESRLGEVFRPEFLNRIEDFVPFRAIDRTARRQVLTAQLERFAQHVFATHGRSLAWDETVLEAGVSAEEAQAGVRGLLRWVQRMVKPAVADALLRESRADVRLGVDDAGQVRARDTVDGPLPEKATSSPVVPLAAPTPEATMASGARP